MGTDTLHSRALIPAVDTTSEGPMPVLELDQVYDAHFEYVVRCLRSLGVRADLCDDALQDVFLVVQDKLAGFDGRAQLRTWIYAIVLRVARRYRARAAHEARRFVPEDEQAESHASSAFEHNERLALARRALAGLDDDKREMFVLAQV